MHYDDNYVEHDGKLWIVRDGKLWPCREVFVDADPAKIPEATDALRRRIIEYMIQNDPFASVLNEK